MKNMKNFRTGLVIFCLGILLMNFAGAVSLTSLYGDTSTVTETATNLILDFDSTKVDTTLRPGDSGVLQILLENTGTKPADNIEFFIYDTAYIKAVSKFDLGTIDGGTTKTVSKVIRVERNTPPGLYTLSVTAIFDSIDANGKRTTNVEKRWEIPIRVYGNPNFQLSLDDGEEFFKDVKQTLKLKGFAMTDAKESSATLSSTCVTVMGSSKKYLGNLAKDKEFAIEYAIKPSSSGTCSLTLAMEYYDASGSLTSEAVSVGIDVQPSDVTFGIVNVDPDTLTYGSTRNLTISLKNLGTSTATDVIAKLTLTKPFTAIKTSEEYIGNILSKETKDVTFEILVDTTSANVAYEIPLTFEYYDASGTKQTVEKSIGIQISGKPMLTVALASSDQLSKGSSGKVSIEVVNSAFTNVKFLTMRLVPTEEYTVLSANEIYVGNLDSDDTDTQEFKIQLSNNVKEGSQVSLKVELLYREEGTNKEYSEQKTVPLTVQPVNTYGVILGPIGAVIGVVSLVVGVFIVVILGWLVYRGIKVAIAYLDKRLFKKGEK